MLLLLHTTDAGQLPTDTPEAVKSKIIELLEILDNVYGDTRTMEEDGGYVVYIWEWASYEQALRAETGIHFETTIPEHVELIPTDTGDYCHILYLFNNEFGVNVILPKMATPQCLLDELD